MRFSASNLNKLVLDEQCRRVSTPAIDVLEKNGDYIVYCAMPGLQKENIELNLADGELQIKADAQLDPPAGMHVHSLEFCSSLYRLRMALPCDADEANISAEYENGVLILTLPRKKQVLIKRLEVKSS